MKISQEKKELAMQYTEENIRGGLNSSESVFNALIRAGILDLPEEATALASGVNGGAAATGHTCGAITGAIMALGAVYGSPDPKSEHRTMVKSPNGKNQTNDPTQDYRYYRMRRFNNLVGDFKKELGTTQCQDIVDRNNGYWNDSRQQECERCIRTGVTLAIHYLEMDEEEANRLPYAENIFQWN